MFQSLGIAGFRSYHPNHLQQINFSRPLTLIWGENGSGKTTIIEALKYVSIGIMPPSCDRGKNFLIEPRLLGASESRGQIRLKFFAYTGRMVLAVRRALLTLTQKGGKYESVEQILKTKDEEGNLLQINHHCAEIEKQIPIILGTSRAVLDKIVLCHQEESLWPFEDSATLKNIFDELFETKKYTQLIDAMWEQRKDCLRKIGEIKKTLPYLLRLYEEDTRRKVAALESMEKMNQDAWKVRPLKQRLTVLEAEAATNKQDAKLDLKFRLGKERRSLEEKLQLNNFCFSRAAETCQKLSSEYYELKGLGEIGEGKANFSIRDAQLKLKSLADQQEELLKMQEKLRAASILSQKEVEIAAEMANAKEFLPQLKQLKRESVTQELVLARIGERLKELDGKKKQLSSLKNELAKCNPSTMIIQKNMSAPEYEEAKAKLAPNSKLLEQAKLKILGCYFALYKKIDDHANYCKKEDDVTEMLKEVQCRIKIKNEELERYSKLPQGPSLKEKIAKLQFAGSEFYQHYLEYCNSKQKCSLCSKPMTPDELRLVAAKCQKIKDKTAEQIRELQEQYIRQTHLHQCEAQPEVAIPKLKAEIASLQSREKILLEKNKNYQMTLKQKEQRKINEKLIQGIKIAKFEREAETESAKKYEKYTKEACLELFNDSVRKYIDFSTLVARQRRRIEIYEQQQARYVQKQAQNERNRAKAKKITQETQQIEEETKHYEIIARIATKLTALLKDRQRLACNPSAASQPHHTTESIASQLKVIDEQSKVLQIRKEYFELTAKMSQLKEQAAGITKEMAAIDDQIAEIDRFLRDSKEKTQEYTNVKIEYGKKVHQIDLKADMAFLEYRKGCEKEYLVQKTKLEQLERMNRDIEKYCAAVESTITRLHHDKMDEVNRIIQDIWKAVYHGNDIHHIEIDTQIDLDSRKRKNYKYAIMMYKEADKMVKLEMKGRCSMGQKVLASIVIRMALAEVFSASARMLTLDQPTTNLDRQHINHLAEQLATLIELNEASEKFQLVIISHDLEFISRLEKYTDHYYEVSRNEHKFSTITRREIHGIFKRA